MTNDLIPDSTVLEDFPGYPFTDSELDAAVGALRAYLGWHLAPQKAETEVLDVDHGQNVLPLTTMHLVSVETVLNPAGVLVTEDAYKVSLKLGLIRGHWAAGYGEAEVEYTHGYDACPPELLPLIAELATAAKDGDITSGANVRLAEIAIGAGSASSAEEDPAAAALRAAVQKYKLMQGFA